jgi:hypothetical protein
MQAHKALDQGTEGWNAYWFRHASAGLIALGESLGTELRDNPGQDLASFFDVFTFPAFGLPRPANSVQLRPKQSDVGRLIANALTDWWSDSETIVTSSKALAHHPDTRVPPHAMESVDWTLFGRTVASLDNLLLAFFSHERESVERRRARFELTEDQFFNPLGTAALDRLQIYSAAGEPLSANQSSGPYLAQFDVIEPANGLRALSIPLIVEIPLIPEFAGLTDELVSESAVSLSLSSSRASWQGVLQRGEGGTLSMLGRIEVKLPRPPFQFEPILTTMTLRAPGDDPLSGVVVPSASCEVVILNCAQQGLLTFPRKASGALGKPVFLGDEEFNLDGSAVSPATHFSVGLSDERAQWLVAWSRQANVSATIDGLEMPALGSLTGFWAHDLSASSSARLSVDEVSFDLRRPEPESLYLSPVLAAIENQSISTESPSLETLNSTRARLERLSCEYAGSPEWMKASGHVALPSDMRIPINSLGPIAGGAMLAPTALAENWAALVAFRVPDEVVSSEEAQKFRAAHAALGVADLVASLTAGNSASPLVSQVSWRHLWENRAALEEYLDSYTDLVEFAKGFGSAAGHFWAAYPFSASVWNTAAGRCVAVLLSPLHPLRLAWLASVESTLWSTRSGLARNLAGTVEGWNLPLLGPRDSAGGRLMAVPVDNGEGQIFLGWSMMVGASIDFPESLTSPEWIGDTRAPGASSSGLNASSAKSALRTYRRINPQVSTVTLDLAAATAMPRLAEIDSAVMAAIRDWTGTGGEALSGGVRVRDSLNRQGEAPRVELAGLLQNEVAVPITWARYKHSPIETQQCNVRLLQDSGVRVEVKASAPSNDGVMGEVPLRRFEATQAALPDRSVAESHPALRPDNGWPAFARALGQIEGALLRPSVQTSLFGALIADRRADWTVTGESLINPSAMVELLAGAGDGDQMLWEWRPPFLAVGRGVPQLESRPFVSVVRIPASFRSQLKAIVARVMGDAETDHQSRVHTVLANLGSRGVGLSSLIAIGGSHSSGALGFDLTFGLLDVAEEPDSDQMVLPIDACEGFLKALAENPDESESQQRADLLVLRLSDDALTLIPIEIKFYGLGAEMPNPYLPQAGDHRLVEPAEQLASTARLLEAVAACEPECPSGNVSTESTLWRNGLAVLVEAAVRLRPARQNGESSSIRLAQRFESLVRGEIPLRIGKPIVAFFSHESSTLAGEDYDVFRVEGKSSEGLSTTFGVLAANSRAAYESLKSPDSEMLVQWRSLLRWASNPVTNEETGLNGVSTRLQGDQPVTEVEPGGNVPLDPSTPADESEQTAESTSTTEGPSAPSRLTIEGDGVRFPVGRLLNSIGEASADFWPGNTALNQMNVGVVGDLGTGKTQLLKALVYQLRRTAADRQPTPVSMLVFDYKRDFQDQAFLDAVGGQVLKPVRIPLNVFTLSVEYTRLAAFQRASAVIDILSKIYAGIGPVQRERLVTVIMDIYEIQGGRPPTLSQVLSKYKELAGADAVTGILTPFVLGEVFDDDPDHVQPFAALIENRVLVLALSELGADANAKNALVVLFLNQYYEYMHGLQKWPYQGSTPQLRRLNSFLLVDEATNIMRYEFPVLMDLMLQGREFGVGVILASQYLSHFKVHESNYGQPLLTWFIHKVPHVSARELATLGIPSASPTTAETISSLNVHEAYYSSLNFPGRFVRGIPFYEFQQNEVGMD